MHNTCTHTGHMLTHTICTHTRTHTTHPQGHTEHTHKDTHNTHTRTHITHAQTHTTDILTYATHITQTHKGTHTVHAHTHALTRIHTHGHGHIPAHSITSNHLTLTCLVSAEAQFEMTRKEHTCLAGLCFTHPHIKDPETITKFMGSQREALSCCILKPCLCGLCHQT